MKTATLILTLLLALGFSTPSLGALKTPHSLVAQQDMRLAGMLRSSIAFERKLANKDVLVSVNRGVISVSGSLDSQHEYQLLMDLIEQVQDNGVTLSTEKLTLNYRTDTP